MITKLRFRPISSSWVAIHPQPKGVIQFIAGAFFGTFGPMFFYRHFLKYLYQQGYTIILLPFNFTFNHYKEAGFLIRQQYEILPEIVRIAKLEGYSYQPYLDDTNFSWIGHSLGCKYISLLEGFSTLPEDKNERDKFIHNFLAKTSSEKRIKQVINDIDDLIDDLTKKVEEVRRLINSYIGCNIDIASLFIKGQKSVLLAPDISDTSSAIRPKFLADFVDFLGLGVTPTPEETHNLIKESKLFNRLGLVGFQSDNIAKVTYDWFINVLRKPPKELQLLLKGGHLKPLGIDLGGQVINLFDTPIIEPIQKRNISFEEPVIDLFDKA